MDPWWWDGYADPDAPRPSVQVETSGQRPMPKPKKGKKVYVHRFGFQPRPVKLKRR